MKYLMMLLVLGALWCTSCSKSDDGGPSNMELITSAAWKYNNAGIDANKDGFIDTGLPPGYLNDCDKDNLLTFKDDGTGTLDEGPTKCDPANPQTAPFTWSFKNNETVINFPSAIIAGITGDVNILSLTSSELIMSKEVSIGAPTTVNAIIILKH